MEFYNHGMNWRWSAKQEETINELNVPAGREALYGGALASELYYRVMEN